MPITAWSAWPSAHRGAACEIDTFLMSCRVIGRTVETALLAQVAAEARTGGASSLEGWFLPTKKNAPAKDFYARHGFELAAEREDGQLWRLDLTPQMCARRSGSAWPLREIAPLASRHRGRVSPACRAHRLHQSALVR